MLTADTAFELWFHAAAFEYSLTYELANTVDIQNLERVIFENALFEVDRQEFSYVITRVTKCHLRQVIGSEREEVSHLSDLICCNSSTRDLDHGTYSVINDGVVFCKYLLSYSVDYSFLSTQFPVSTN